MSEEILKKLKNCDKSPEPLPKITKEESDKLACEIAQKRGYTKEMGMVNNPYSIQKKHNLIYQ